MIANMQIIERVGGNRGQLIGHILPGGNIQHRRPQGAKRWQPGLGRQNSRRLQRRERLVAQAKETQSAAISAGPFDERGMLALLTRPTAEDQAEVVNAGPPVAAAIQAHLADKSQWVAAAIAHRPRLAGRPPGTPTKARPGRIKRVLAPLQPQAQARAGNVLKLLGQRVLQRGCIHHEADLSACGISARGSITVNRLPLPSSDVAQIWPWCRSMISFQMASPNPRARCGPLRAVLARKKRSKIRESSSWGIPTPSSSTVSSAFCAWQASVRYTGRSASEYFTALFSRLLSTWASRSASARIKTGASLKETSIRRPLVISCSSAA